MSSHGFEMIQNDTKNDTKTYHLEHLGGFGSELIRMDTKTDHLEHLRDLGPEMTPNGTRTDRLEYLGGHSPKMSRFESSKPL